MYVYDQDYIFDICKDDSVFKASLETNLFLLEHTLHVNEVINNWLGMIKYIWAWVCAGVCVCIQFWEQDDSFKLWKFLKFGEYIN